MTRIFAKPLVLHNQVWKDYWVADNGDIWSTKTSVHRKLKANFSGSNPYPRVTLSRNGKLTTVAVHRIVCETSHIFPIPSGVSKAEWKRTPESVRTLISSLYQVNHIDHDHTNFHPDNLEWVTAKENTHKYQDHRRSL